nr:hypothetical protein [Streptomyces yerevanensis]
MSVDGEVRRLKSEEDEPGWEVDPDDDWGVAVIATVGRQLKLRREAVGRSDGAFNGRPTSDPKQLRILELRYGTIRAQALPPRESLAFIEQLLGET